MIWPLSNNMGQYECAYLSLSTMLNDFETYQADHRGYAVC